MTFERIELADRDHRRDDRNELVTRLALYDDGTFARRLAAPGQLVTTIEPAGATVVLERNAAERPLGTGATEIAPGSYVLVASAPGRATVRMPLLIRAGDRQHIAFELPHAAAIPTGFVYIPPGRFLYGSRDPETVRTFFEAAPMHERYTAAFLIGITEVTYAQWIEFLDDQPSAVRERHRPQAAVSSTMQPGDTIELREVGTTWELTIAPSSVAYRVRADQGFEYRDRIVRRRQNWLRFAVSGISADDAQVYTAWLDRTRRVPRARLCSEPEWEHAMRGADGRAYPHGEHLAPDDVNIDVTYGRREGGFGPDEVASHPASNSPFDLADGSGNVWEIVRSTTGFMGRGGSFFQGANTAHLANRMGTMTATQRNLLVGIRICADPS
jgi:formylglycine-generating enzyme required for sulfatase activity